MDTGDMHPIEPTAQLSLKEAQIIVSRKLISKQGLILIDDVRNTTPLQRGEPSQLGKAKYSLPYLLQNGFVMVMNEYQVILKRHETEIPRFLQASLLVSSPTPTKKVLHLTFHSGCQKELETVAQKLNWNLESWYVLDGNNRTKLDPHAKYNNIYNIGFDRAERIWMLHQTYFESFDIIITSDTVPLSRIFLQNKHWSKPLIVWICNRFDYYDGEKQDCQFPDPAYYELMKDAIKRPNIKFIAYTPYEYEYAKNKKNITFGDIVIHPSGLSVFDNDNEKKELTAVIVTADADLFIQPRLTNNNLQSIQAECKKVGLNTISFAYNHPTQLLKYKGVLFCPYQLSNLALFENIQLGIVHFVPSLKFYEQECSKERMTHFPASSQQHEFCDWYSPTFSTCFIYFDSWNDLANKVRTTNYSLMQDKVKRFGELHANTMLQRWTAVKESLLIETKFIKQ